MEKYTFPYIPSSTDSDTGWHVLTVLLGMRGKSCTTDIQKYRFPTEGEDTNAAGDLALVLLTLDLHAEC